MLVYIAAPLFSEAERLFNLRLREFVQKFGFSTYLPQEDGGLYSELIKQGEPEDKVSRKLFTLDYENVEDCDVLVAVLDGRTVDEGVSFELGAAYALGKRRIGFKTDSRSCELGKDNLMIEQALERIARNWNELEQYLVECLARAHS
jgi:nucleoside 2-deoxyribosyltransferase